MMKQLITLQNPLINIKSTTLSPLISQTHFLNPKTHFRNTKIYAKWGKKRSGSQNSRTNKLIFNAITTVASNLKILPEPFDSIVKELWVVSGGGNGGKIRFKNGFGGGGGDGNRGKRNKSKLGFLIVLGISIGLGIWVVSGEEKMSNLGGGLGLLCAVMFFVVGYCLWRRDFRNWILGFFCGVCLMGLGLGFKDNGDLIKFVDGFKVNFCNFEVLKKKKKKRRFNRWI